MRRLDLPFPLQLALPALLLSRPITVMAQGDVYRTQLTGHLLTFRNCTLVYMTYQLLGFAGLWSDLSL